jgi:preprotein translocase subunit YajC
MIGVTDVMAATGKAAQPGLMESLSSMLPMFLIVFVLFYFMMIRPQTKKAKEQQALLDGLKVGDEVMTSSGMLAKVMKIKDDFIAIAPADAVTVSVQKAAISSVLPKGTMKSME